MAVHRGAFILLLSVASAPQSAHALAARTAANPIRKVVMMLQNMQKKVIQEGEEQQVLYDKFMCYCHTGVGDLENSIAVGTAKIESLTASQRADLEKKVMTDQSLKANQASLAEAKAAMASATALRQKESKAYAKFKADSDENLIALTKAIAAIEHGAYGSFLQTQSAEIIRQFAMERANMADAKRQELLAFLSGTQDQGYIPQSGEIIGILKQMFDEMGADLSKATADENSAIQTYEALMDAKTKEKNTLQAQIEEEMMRSGELAVTLAAIANDLEDTNQALTEDKAFLAELKKSCATKTQEYEVIKKTRAEELLALAETIKVLNDDDALELFKKTLPSAGSSFVEIKTDRVAAKARALALLRGKGLKSRPELDLVELALQGKQIGFEKVISMIDDMVKNLKKEQEDDDNLKEYCNTAFDKSDDKKKELEHSISDSEAAIDDLEGAIKMLAEEIQALNDGVKALDKSVAEATDMRKQEHADYTELMTNDAGAKEVLLWAKNRLNKFYNPKLYKAPPKRELSNEDRIVVSMGGTLAPTPPPGGIADTGIMASLAQVAPPPPPETFGAYSKKTEESTGVIGMIDILVKDLDKEMQEATVSEKDAQSDYETMMADAAAKRAADSKSITEKTSAKANAEEALAAEQDKKAGTQTTLMETLEFIHDLHVECDWLLKYYTVRKEARDNEIDALGKAKAVLSGADYS